MRDFGTSGAEGLAVGASVLACIALGSHLPLIAGIGLVLLIGYARLWANRQYHPDGTPRGRRK